MKESRTTQMPRHLETQRNHIIIFRFDFASFRLSTSSSLACERKKITRTRDRFHQVRGERWTRLIIWSPWISNTRARNIRHISKHAFADVVHLIWSVSRRRRANYPSSCWTLRKFKPSHFDHPDSASNNLSSWERMLNVAQMAPECHWNISSSFT